MPKKKKSGNRTCDDRKCEIRNLRMDQITLSEDEESPRKTYEDDPEIKELAESIKKYGLLQPIIVVPRPTYISLRRKGHLCGGGPHTPHRIKQEKKRIEEDEDKYVILAGRRRFEAAKRVGLEEIPATIISNAYPCEIFIIENELRKDLTLLEKARAYNDAIKEHHRYSNKKLGECLGKSKTKIANILKLDDLHESIKRECEESNRYLDESIKEESEKPNFGESVLLEIAKAPKSGQMEIWKMAKKDKNFTVRQARAARKKIQESKEKDRNGVMDDDEDEEEEEEIID